MSAQLSHKTIFLFDNSSYFSTNCGQTYEFDVSIRSKQSNQQQNPSSKLNPLNKSLWTCNIESALEFARIVYDLFPENKLIQMITSKHDAMLNSWNESEQGLEHVCKFIFVVELNYTIAF